VLLELFQRCIGKCKGKRTYVHLDDDAVAKSGFQNNIVGVVGIKVKLWQHLKGSMDAVNPADSLCGFPSTWIVLKRA